MLTQHSHNDHGKGSVPKQTGFQGFLVVAIHVVIFKATPKVAV